MCLVDPFAAQGASSPCTSGAVNGRDGLVPQCDPQSVADTLGVDLATVPNGDIAFAEPLPVGECDPWLANFQKILTDGDPTGSGTFHEVPYQSFLPDIVKVRQRTVDGLRMDALQSVRQGTDPTTGEAVPLDSVRIPYTFDTSALAPGDEITVTATMHFRHLPPEFVRALAKAQDGLRNVTPSARLDDPQALIDNLVITDVVTAESGDGPQLACPGPQNEDGATILSCVQRLSGVHAVDLGAGAGGAPSRRARSVDGGRRRRRVHDRRARSSPGDAGRGGGRSASPSPPADDRPARPGVPGAGAGRRAWSPCTAAGGPRGAPPASHGCAAGHCSPARG